jgi:hypothetical protein
VPARLGRRIATLKEPLGASVVRVPVKIRFRLSVSRTDQVWPTRFESTSNSIESLPSSGFALSFHVAPTVQVPLDLTSGVPPLAFAAGATRTRPVSAAVLAVMAAAVRRAFMRGSEVSCPVGLLRRSRSVGTDCVSSGRGLQPSDGSST